MVTLTCTEPIGILRLPFLDLRMQLWHALVVERHFTADKHIQNDTKAPYVYFWSIVWLRLQQFWRREIQGTTEGLEEIIRYVQVAQAEVYDLNVASLADEDVLNLEISVNDAVLVAVIKSARYLSSELPSVLFLEPSVRYDVVQHLTAVDVFE